MWVGISFSQYAPLGLKMIKCARRAIRGSEARTGTRPREYVFHRILRAQKKKHAARGDEKLTLLKTVCRWRCALPYLPILSQLPAVWAYNGQNFHLFVCKNFMISVYSHSPAKTYKGCPEGLKPNCRQRSKGLFKQSTCRKW